MSNKNNIPLVDRGWSQMSDILETEMPQKKKRRRFFLWFFLGGIVLLGGFSALYLSESHDIPKSPNLPKSQIAHSQDREIEKNVSTKTKDKNVEPGNQEKKSNDIPNKEVSIGLQVESDEKDKADIITDQSKTDNNDIHIQNDQDQKVLIKLNFKNNEIKKVFDPKNFIANNRLTKINQEVQLAQSSVSNPNEMNERQIVEKVDRSTRQKVSSVDKLRYPDVAAVISNRKEPIAAFNSSIDIITILESDGSIQKAPSNKRVNTYAFVAGMYDTRPSGVGYQFGLGLSLDKKNFSLFTELGYGKVSYTPNSIETEVPIVPILEEIATTGSEYSADESEINNIKNIVNADRLSNNTWINELDYISLRIGGEKSITRRLSLLADVSYARFLSISNNQLIFNTGISIVGQDLNLESYNINNMDLSDNGVFSKAEWSTSVGGSYQISSQLDLVVSYRFGLSNIYSNEPYDLDSFTSNMGEQDIQFSEPSLYRNGVELKMKYNF